MAHRQLTPLSAVFILVVSGTELSVKERGECKLALSISYRNGPAKYQGFPDGRVVKNQPAMQETQETWVQSLRGEDPLEEGMTTHSSILTGRIPWMEEPGRLQSMGSQRVGHY